ncbi:hypothetical protein [Sediminibacillus albus]|uniref:Uncharacterized protein n=1 Tax=Sediminibacillus albus TaxID=407036 RepID=A0A1G8YVC7_9BACI|nr:hypothetical protein [Sediminibacillus albus]SDK06025.1 hypothetical protein SAMN05216243_1816 [Sediminibacillus albus]
MTDNKQYSLNSLYIPLIIAIPANIFFLVRLQFGVYYQWAWVSFAVFTLFLLITGGISITRKERKSQILGCIYLLSAVIFVALAFLIS